MEGEVRGDARQHALLVHVARLALSDSAPALSVAVAPSLCLAEDLMRAMADDEGEQDGADGQPESPHHQQLRIIIENTGPGFDSQLRLSIEDTIAAGLGGEVFVPFAVGACRVDSLISEGSVIVGAVLRTAANVQLIVSADAVAVVVPALSPGEPSPTLFGVGFLLTSDQAQEGVDWRDAHRRLLDAVRAELDLQPSDLPSAWEPLLALHLGTLGVLHDRLHGLPPAEEAPPRLPEENEGTPPDFAQQLFALHRDASILPVGSDVVIPWSGQLGQVRDMRYGDTIGEDQVDIQLPDGVVIRLTSWTLAIVPPPAVAA